MVVVPVLAGIPSPPISSSRATGKAHARNIDRMVSNSSVQASAAPPPPPEEAGNHADPLPQGGTEVAAQDSWVLQHCSDLLEAKRRSYDILRADAAQSAAVLRDLDAMLGQIRSWRKDNSDTGGPDERETNLKILSEKVHRSLQRTSAEIQHVQEDVEVLSRFCGGGVIPPAYDSYNVKQEDVEKMVAHVQKVKGQGPEAPQKGTTAKVMVPQLQLGLLTKEHPRLAPPTEELRAGMRSGRSSASSSSDAREEDADAAADIRGAAKVLVPQLQLDLLPQEHPQLPPALTADTRSGSGSSCSSSARSPPGVAATMQVPCVHAVTLAPGTPLMPSSQGIPHLVAPPPPVLQQQPCLGRPASMVTLPVAVTPPLPPAAPAELAAQSAAIRCVSPLAAACRGPVNSRGSNVGIGVRKSNSTASLRSLSLRPGTQLVQQPLQATSAATGPGFGSPALGHRGEQSGVGVSPLRCSSTTAPARPLISNTASRARARASHPNPRMPPSCQSSVGWQARGVTKQSSPSPERQRVAAAASPLRSAWAGNPALQPSCSTPCLPCAARVQAVAGAWAATGVAADVSSAAGAAATVVPGVACSTGGGWSSPGPPPGSTAIQVGSLNQSRTDGAARHSSPTWPKR